MKVLIVDDERAIGRLIETSLNNRGFTARWIDRADNIVEEVRTFSPDVILLDINMPGKSGFEALKEIREKGINTPVIMISILSQDFNIDMAYDLGATDYITKPFSLNHLIRKLERLLR
ncbi:MAG: response regulator [Aquificota bacterium]|nr:response regulator [Aquificota bacterium]